MEWDPESGWGAGSPSFSARLANQSRHRNPPFSTVLNAQVIGFEPDGAWCITMGVSLHWRPKGMPMTAFREMRIKSAEGLHPMARKPGDDVSSACIP
jgi:hypothetical protein